MFVLLYGVVHLLMAGGVMVGMVRLDERTTDDRDRDY